MPNITSRYPQFLYSALRLKESGLPIELDDEIIQSTIDVYQQGWALANYNHRKLTGGLQFANEIVMISTGRFPPDANPVITEEPFQKKLLAMKFIGNTAAVGGTNTELLYRKLIDAPFEDQLAPIKAQDAIGTGEEGGSIRYLCDYSPGGTTLWIPDEWQLILTTSATGVAEDTWQLEYLWAEIPAGFNIGQAG